MVNISVDPAVLVAALVAAGYTVTTPPVSPPIVPPVGYVAPMLKTVMCQNGQTPLLPQDYSYNATDAHADVIDGGRGNAACVKVMQTGAWGGFQPSCLNGQSLNFQSSTHIMASINAPKGSQFSMQFLRAGDVAIKCAHDTLFTKTVDGWEDVTFLKSDLMTDIALGDVSATIYKGAIQSKLGVIPAAGFHFLVDNWGGI